MERMEELIFGLINELGNDFALGEIIDATYDVNFEEISYAELLEIVTVRLLRRRTAKSSSEREPKWWEV